MAATIPKAPALNKHDFEILSDFRYEIRKFERFSEEVTRQHGLTPLQYLLLLHIKGYCTIPPARTGAAAWCGCTNFALRKAGTGRTPSILGRPATDRDSSSERR